MPRLVPGPVVDSPAVLSATAVPATTGRAGSSAPAAPGTATDLTWDTFAGLVLSTALAAPVRDGAVRVVAVDGHSGSGKTWLAARLAHLLDAPVHHVDELVPGWDGLADGITHVTDHLLRPWSQARTARVREYDWHAARPGAWRELAPVPLVVVEGSGIGAVPDRSLLAALVWMDTPGPVRDARLDDREDSLTYAPFRDVWAAQEHALVTQACTPERADLRVLAASDDGATVRHQDEVAR